MTRKLMTLIFALAVLASCRGREAALTSSYGDRVITGQIVLGEGVADSSPAGVQVSVVGTGMSTTLGADGKFAFAGVPDGAELQISRADGISARTPAVSGVLEVTPSGVKSSGRGRGPKKTEPQNQYEGVLLQDATTDSLTILDSHRQTVAIALTTTTLIRKGDKIVNATDLLKGDRVHVQATMVKDVLTASLVIVQNEDGQGHGPEQQYEGVLTKDGAADSLTLLDSHKQTVTVALTSSTVIRKGNATVDPTTLKTGDRVHVKATMVGTVLTATEVIVQGGSDGSDDDQGDSTMTANGPVKSVDGTTLIVTSQPKGDVTVQTDGKTIIRKQGTIIQVSDIKAGDEVNTMGTRIDDHTLLARQIEVRGNSKH